MATRERWHGATWRIAGQVRYHRKNLNEKKVRRAGLRILR